jgi:hypothetical protein
VPGLGLRITDVAGLVALTGFACREQRIYS